MKKNRVAVLALALMAVRAVAEPLSEPVTTCDWNNPGVNPYRGSPALAVLSYSAIPIWPRLVLASRIGRVTPTDYAMVTRGDIESLNGFSYSPQLTEMHFGGSKKCTLPDRSQWSPTRRELSPVWCFAGECVTMPRICNNVSRIFQRVVPWNPEAVRRLQPTPHAAAEPSTEVLTGLALLAAVCCTSRRRLQNRKKRTPLWESDPAHGPTTTR